MRFCRDRTSSISDRRWALHCWRSWSAFFASASSLFESSTEVSLTDGAFDDKLLLEFCNGANDSTKLIKRY